MTPRGPDRYEAKAKELCLTEWRSIAAALRAEHDDALERAAQVADSHCPINTTGHVCTPMEIARAIRAVASPAAAPAAVLTDAERDAFYAGLPLPAPAAEIGTCANFWHPGHGKEIHTRREAVGDVSAVHADYVNDSGCINWRPAPPSEPAALLPRVLAALEKWADYDGGEMHDLAAELRAYIAARAATHAKGEGT